MDVRRQLPPKRAKQPSPNQRHARPPTRTVRPPPLLSPTLKQVLPRNPNALFVNFAQKSDVVANAVGLLPIRCLPRLIRGKARACGLHLARQACAFFRRTFARAAFGRELGKSPTANESVSRRSCEGGTVLVLGGRFSSVIGRTKSRRTRTELLERDVACCAERQRADGNGDGSERVCGADAGTGAGTGGTAEAKRDGNPTATAKP